MKEAILPWRPRSETEATANFAAFIEWLRSVRDMTDATPDKIAAWRRHDPASLLDAVEAFLWLTPADGWGGNLRRHHGSRIAVARGARVWSRDAIAASESAWRAAAGPMAVGAYPVLVRMAADHLLAADTRPDDRILWRGDPLDPWPWGALPLGAAVVFP